MSLWAIELFAARLPRNITEGQLSTLVKTLAFGNATKTMRSAEPYPALPGFKIALETTLVPSSNMNDMGDGSASLPLVIPSPRLHLTKGVGQDLEFSINLSTQQLLQTMASIGMMGKWSFIDEKDSFATAALFSSFTQLNGFNDSFSGKDFEVGVLASKDYVRLKPYIGAGIILATASVPKSICTVTQNKTVFSPHLFVGAEIELPMNISLQLDFADSVPTGSFALGYRF